MVDTQMMTPLEKQFAQHISYLKRKQRSAATLSAYQSTYEAFVRDGYTEVSDETVEQFLSKYTNPQTYNKVLVHFWSFANGKYTTPQTCAGLTLEKQPVKKGLPPVIPEDESKRLLDELKQEHLTSWAVLTVMRNTGLRIGEATKLRSINYHDLQGTPCVKFIGKGGRERIVPLNDEALRAFQVYASRPEVRPHAIRVHVREAARKVGVRLRPHWFRHTLATGLRARGFTWEDIADLLGNSAEVVKEFYGRMDHVKLHNMVRGI